jgi:hypothetical protein
MLALIIIGILVAVLIVAFFLGRSGDFNKKGTPEQEKTQPEKKYSSTANVYLPSSVWSAFTPNPAGQQEGSGSCLNYTQSSNPYSIGVPCINGGTGCLNTSGPGSYYISTQSCNDPDQILAQAGTHICQKPNSGSAGTGCIASTKFTYDGTTYYPGDSVPTGVIEGIIDPTSSAYFIPCGNNPCQGTIGLLIPNFSPIENAAAITSNINQCITFDALGEDNSAKNPARYDVKLESCDLTNFNQIFRMVRYSLNLDYSFTQDDNGIYAAYIFRSNGFYLAPNLEFQPTFDDNGLQNGVTYFFDRLVVDENLNGCDTGPTGPIGTNTVHQGVKLLLIDPKDDTVRNGVYWLLQNQTPNPIVPAGTNNFTNFLGCMDAKYDSVYSSVPYPVAFSECANQNNGIPTWFQPPSSDFSSSSQVAAYQGDDVYLPISPQQIVYIPNIYLVPKDNTNLAEYWTYLTNQFSLQLLYKTTPSNLSCGTAVATPILMPFLQKMEATVYSGTESDSGSNNNFRICDVVQSSMVLPSNIPSSITISQVLPKDNQFISMVSYIPQMQTRVSSLMTIDFSGGDNDALGKASATVCSKNTNFGTPVTYKGSYNPFNATLLT